jgi:hypothetical protein
MALKCWTRKFTNKQGKTKTWVNCEEGVKPRKRLPEKPPDIRNRASLENSPESQENITKTLRREEMNKRRDIELQRLTNEMQPSVSRFSDQEKTIEQKEIEAMEKEMKRYRIEEEQQRQESYNRFGMHLQTTGGGGFGNNTLSLKQELERDTKLLEQKIRNQKKELKKFKEQKPNIYSDERLKQLEKELKDLPIVYKEREAREKEREALRKERKAREKEREAREKEREKEREAREKEREALLKEREALRKEIEKLKF